MVTSRAKWVKDKFRSRSFRYSFAAMVVMGAAISVPLLAIAGWMYRTDMKKQIVELHEQTAMSLSRENASEFAAMTAPMLTIVNLVALESVDRTTLKREVDFIASSNQYVHDIRIVDENGAVVTGSDPLNRAGDFDGFAGLKEIRAGRVYKSGIIIGEDLKYIVEMAWPVTRAHMYAGFVFSRIEFSRLWSGMDLIKVAPDSNLMLVDRVNGRVMADQSRQKLGTIYTSGDAASGTEGTGTPDGKPTSGKEQATWEYKGQVISRFQIKDWPVDVVVESRMATLQAKMIENLRFIFTLTIVWLGAGCVVSFFVAILLTAPLGKLSKLMGEIPHDMSLRAQDHGGEFTLISNSLNNMLESINNQERLLIEQAAVAAVGRTAAALAHDIRGGMHTIINAAALFEIKPEMAKNIISQSVKRMCDMLDDVLEFSRSGSPVLAPVTIERLFANYDRSWILAERFNGKKIEIIPGDPGLTAMMDLKKMLRALDNMGRNSLEAGANLVTMTWKQDGDWILITVVDDGKGIPKDIREKIFTPFFTTKRGGFGIGMSIIEVVIKSHKGKLEVLSPEAGGTQIKIRLPQISSRSAKVAEAISGS
ncbi:MAG: sensor histidine kinase [Nitrospinae bacterium]|nr:sensor histidine kinase [Nitrospinota bacterium]